jgi:predicted dehydrogenase
MPKRKLNVALIGYKFMGKAHSHAWKSVGAFFDLDAEPNLEVVCGRNAGALKEFGDRWGWETTDTNWGDVVIRDDVDIVDVAVPTADHYEIVVAAARAGKHIFCEKPFALSASQAREMLSVAEAEGVTHYLNHNYRRCPATGRKNHNNFEIYAARDPSRSIWNG